MSRMAESWWQTRPEIRTQVALRAERPETEPQLARKEKKLPFFLSIKTKAGQSTETNVTIEGFGKGAFET
ncbi:MAG: hypothetical protein R3D26_03410 [Cyanobacteriota/Melainabacteria group bacterium]